MFRHHPRKGNSFRSDPTYKNALVHIIVSRLMRKGKKTLSCCIFYSTLSKIRDETQSDPLFVFEHAIRIVTPIVQLKSCRIGGATYQIPISISLRRGTAVAIQWILIFARTRSESGMDVCLSGPPIAREGVIIHPSLPSTFDPFSRNVFRIFVG